MVRYVVVFDISDDVTRKRVGEALEAYGMRVQRSVFEVVFRTKRQFDSLVLEIETLIDKEVDAVRFYAQCEHCVRKALDVTGRDVPFDKQAVYFF